MACIYLHFLNALERSALTKSATLRNYPASTFGGMCVEKITKNERARGRTLRTTVLTHRGAHLLRKTCA